jgi:hypothetical protein
LLLTSDNSNTLLVVECQQQFEKSYAVRQNPESVAGPSLTFDRASQRFGCGYAEEAEASCLTQKNAHPSTRHAEPLRLSLRLVHNLTIGQ